MSSLTFFSVVAGGADHLLSQECDNLIVCSLVIEDQGIGDPEQKALPGSCARTWNELVIGVVHPNTEAGQPNPGKVGKGVVDVEGGEVGLHVGGADQGGHRLPGRKCDESFET